MELLLQVERHLFERTLGGTSYVLIVPRLQCLGINLAIQLWRPSKQALSVSLRPRAVRPDFL